MSITTTYLVTGATRGIGAEIVKQLLRRSDAVVIAGVRDTSNSAAKALASANAKLIVVQLDASSASDPQRAVETLASKHDIHHIDTLIANAGIATDFLAVKDVKPADALHTYDVNLNGPLRLFQAFLPLLQRSNTPKFIAVSTAIASLTYQPNLPYKAFTYGASKVALNYLVVRAALEHPEITSIALHPGLVATDLAHEAVSSFNSSLDEQKALTTEQSASAVIALSDAAKHDTHSGKFFNAPEGTDVELPW